jgi:hypothetical protein
MGVYNGRKRDARASTGRQVSRDGRRQGIGHFEGSHSLDHCIVVATLYLSWNLDDCKVRRFVCIDMQLNGPSAL